MPRDVGGEDPGARDHVRRQHGYRRVFRGDAERRAGRAVPALSDLQPCRRDRRPGVRRGRARCHGWPGQRPGQGPLRLPAGDPPDLGRDVEQGGHAGRVPKGVGGRIRRPGPDVANRTSPAGRRSCLLPGRGVAWARCHGASRDSRAGPRGPRWPGDHQRLQSPHGHERHSAIRRRPLAEAS